MKYRLLLTNTADGEEREIIVPAHLPLEDLSPKLKVEFQLPLCDNCWHRFLSRGTAYVMNEIMAAEIEIRHENNLYVGRYRNSERARLKNIFTVIGSVITYIQQENGNDKYKIRITLLERI